MQDIVSMGMIVGLLAFLFKFLLKKYEINKHIL